MEKQLDRDLCRKIIETARDYGDAAMHQCRGVVTAMRLTDKISDAGVVAVAEDLYDHYCADEFKSNAPRHEFISFVTEITDTIPSDWHEDTSITSVMDRLACRMGDIFARDENILTPLAFQLEAAFIAYCVVYDIVINSNRYNSKIKHLYFIYSHNIHRKNAGITDFDKFKNYITRNIA